jgi:hypothetical protein
MFAPHRRIRRGAQLSSALTAMIAAAALLAPAAASAETQITTQATADDGAFLPFAPAPAEAASMCLVDTGVAVNPDTEAAVVERTAIDGGSGEDVSPTMHGTVLAMMAAAPVNVWGMVGTAPGAIRIVSVRILEPGKTTFPFSAYASGIAECLQRQEQDNIRVINLSLGTSEAPSGEGYKAFANSMKEARNYGVAVVAAAGNDNGGPVEYPAAYPGVLSVGASDTQTGQFCTFSNRGEGLALIAPGCYLDGADPLSGNADENYWQGTSEASAITSAALTALISYKPTLTAEEAEQDLTTAHDGVLDIAQTFRDAGLSAVVSAGEAAEPKPLASPPAPQPTSMAAPTPAPTPPQQLAPSEVMTLTGRFPMPDARLRRHHHRGLLVVPAHPAEAQTEVRLFGWRRHHRRPLRLLRARHGSFTRLRLPQHVVAVNVRYVDPYDLERDGPWQSLRLPRDQRRQHPGHHAQARKHHRRLQHTGP